MGEFGWANGFGLILPPLISWDTYRFAMKLKVDINTCNIKKIYQFQGTKCSESKIAIEDHVRCIKFHSILQKHKTHSELIIYAYDIENNQ